MEFIDTHQHLIFRNRFTYEWTKGIPALAKGDFTTSDYGALTDNKGIVGTLFMETAVDDENYKAEARFVSELVGSDGMLGQIASCRPEEDVGFDAWLDECRNLSVVGFRRILHVMPDELSQSSNFRANVKKIGKEGLPFEICVLARQLPIAADLARSCDRQRFVLNHCGVPDIAGEAFESWAADIAKVAELSHVMVKLSGLTAYCKPGTATKATLLPWVNHIIETFGSERIVWGGDWPVVNLGSGLEEWISITRELLEDLSPDEQAAISQENARTVYGI